MINKISSNIFRFLFLVMFQVAILNNIDLGEYAHAHLYILFIILLPFETPKWLLIISGFLLGISVDIFSDTIGLHAFATVFIAFLRPSILKSFEPHDGYSIGSSPISNNYGFNWFIRYSALIAIIHNLIFFYIEAFSFSFFFSTLLTAILSTIFTLILIILSRLLIIRR